MRGYELTGFQIALDFEFFTYVPADGEISVEEITKKAGLDKYRKGRVVRLLTKQRFFQGCTPGFFSHKSFYLAL